MPEPPEVENLRPGLQPAPAGRRLLGVEQRRADLRWPLPPDFARRLRERTVTRLVRRAKFLLAELDGEETLIVHLGMSGRFLVAPAAPDLRPGAHDHVL